MCSILLIHASESSVRIRSSCPKHSRRSPKEWGVESTAPGITTSIWFQEIRCRWSSLALFSGGKLIRPHSLGVWNLPSRCKYGSKRLGPGTAYSLFCPRISFNPFNVKWLIHNNQPIHHEKSLQGDRLAASESDKGLIQCTPDKV